MLQTNDTNYDIILIQEPWFGNVATLRSDTDPDGNTQLDFTANNKWTTLSPPQSPNSSPKVCAYINRRTINQTRIINHIPPAPLISPNSMVIDILSTADRDRIDLRIVNVYHDKPGSGHALGHIFSHALDDATPTLFMGDFNSHSSRWSLPHSPHSSWAPAFHEWMDSNGLEILNPTNEHTWKQKGKRPSIIDLALANEAARYFTNLSALTVSWESSISDHAALLINFYPDTHTHTPQDETTNRFHIDAAKKDDWINTFRQSIKDRAVLLETDPTIASKSYHEAIIATCERHLTKIKTGTPKGVVWWNQDCADKLLTLKHSPVGDQRRMASKDFKGAVRNAKREWAHQQLFETIDVDNIWRMARVRKGRRSQVLPPLKDADGITHSDTDTKATLLKSRFFPSKTNTVDIPQA